MFTTSNRRESWRLTQPDPTLVPSSPKSSAMPQVQVISWECEDGYKLYGTRELSQHHNVPADNIHDLNTSIPSEVRKYPRGCWAPELTLTLARPQSYPDIQPLPCSAHSVWGTQLVLSLATRTECYSSERPYCEF